MAPRIRSLISILLVVLLPGIWLLLGTWTESELTYLNGFLVALSASIALAMWFASVTSVDEVKVRQIQKHSGSQARPRPVRRLLIYLLHSIIVGASVSLLVGLALRLLREGRVILGIQADNLAHIAIAIIVPYMGIYAVLYTTKDRAKRAKLERVARTLHELNGDIHPSASPKVISPGVNDSAAKIGRVLSHLIATVDQDWRMTKLLYRGKIPTTGWILIPDGGSFRTVHLCGWDPIYDEVAREHRPQVNNPQAMEALEATRAEKASTFRPKAYEAWFANEYKVALWACSSLTGHAYAQGGPFAYKRISHSPVFDESYLDHIPEEHRKRYKFRSCAGIRLELSRNPLGVLMLHDTSEYGFGDKDTLSLRIYGGIISQLLAEALRSGAYQTEVCYRC